MGSAHAESELLNEMEDAVLKRECFRTCCQTLATYTVNNFSLTIHSEIDPSDG